MCKTISILITPSKNDVDKYVDKFMNYPHEKLMCGQLIVINKLST